MKDIVIATINHEKIVVTPELLVPIRPICQALGVSIPDQRKKLKAHPILSSVLRLIPMIGADGKPHEMLCLPLKYALGWVFTIQPNNVRPETRERLITAQKKCYEALVLSSYQLEPIFGSHQA
jgi:hypothetical protein